MGTERFYKPGSFYRICDRTGFATRAERTRMEWNNLIVSDRVWEARQPQDFVKGVNDSQNVPNARPRSPNPAVGTSLTAQFQSFNNPGMSSQFDVQGGQIMVVKAASVVTAANFPSGF
jgi:hypothetical protein